MRLKCGTYTVLEGHTGFLKVKIGRMRLVAVRTYDGKGTPITWKLNDFNLLNNNPTSVYNMKYVQNIDSLYTLVVLKWSEKTYTVLEGHAGCLKVKIGRMRLGALRTYDGTGTPLTSKLYDFNFLVIIRRRFMRKINMTRRRKRMTEWWGIWEQKLKRRRNTNKSCNCWQRYKRRKVFEEKKENW